MALGSAVQEEDEIDHLDRWFAVRANAGTVDPPRNPDQFAGLRTGQRDGDWALIRADYPLDAFNHARSLQRRAGGDRPLRDRRREQHLGQDKRHLIGV
jgi:hypothetical protein